MEQLYFDLVEDLGSFPRCERFQIVSDAFSVDSSPRLLEHRVQSQVSFSSVFDGNSMEIFKWSVQTGFLQSKQTPPP